MVLANIFERGSPREWAGELHPGTRLGRYELLVPVGTGGMACVWAARLLGQRGFSKLVAIKTILPHLAQDTQFEKMFLDEARIAACVRHPNVCDLYELGEEGPVLYLAMEWINGDSLFRLFRPAGESVPLEPRIAARIIADACAGLHAAHELSDDLGRSLNVIHRDVSPQNILLSLEGAVKVTDFGVAKARGQLHATTQGGQIKGKVGYMAPEHIRGVPTDRRADLFAMGCVLYHVTTGARPFRGANEAQVLEAILRGVYEPPTAIGGYPPPLARVVERALATDPGKRFETAEQMGMALEGWLAESGAPVMGPQVGSCVRERLGEALAKRYARMREAMTTLGQLASAEAASRHSGAPSATMRISSELTAIDIPVDVFTSYGVVSLPRNLPERDPEGRPPDAPEPVAPASAPPRPPSRVVTLAVAIALALGSIGALVGWARRSAGPTGPSLRPIAAETAVRPIVTAAPPRPVAADDSHRTAAACSCAVSPSADGPTTATRRTPPDTANGTQRGVKSNRRDDDIPIYR